MWKPPSDREGGFEEVSEFSTMQGKRSDRRGCRGLSSGVRGLSLEDFLQ